MSLGPGSRVGAYEVLSLVGSGGMGVVYRARDHKLLRTVAIKVLSDPDRDKTNEELLLEEARAASALSHANICVVYEVGEWEGRPFIVMEFVDGKPLNALIPPEGLPADKVIRYGIQIADAVAHAHARGVLHRDLKSSNVIVSKEGIAKVVDFGLARRVLQQGKLAIFGLSTADAGEMAAEFQRPLAGTLSHMAPEALRGGLPSVATDLWGLGVLLHEMACGSLPFSGSAPFELTGAILHSAPAPMPSRVPAGVRMIVARCLEKEPVDRYEAAGEVRAALQAVQSDTAVPLVVPPVRGRRPRWPWALGAGLIAAGLGVFLLMPAGNQGTSPRLPASARLTLVVSSDRQAYDPALSPDGTMIAYVAEDERGRFDLFGGRAAGGERVRLTNDENVESHPRFSPDGERILFTRRRSGSGQVELAVVPTLGGDISTVVVDGSQGVWSPDGRRVAFVASNRSGGALALAIAGADGSEARRVLAASGEYPGVRHPAWSPDGRTLAVVRGTGGIAGELWLLDADGKGLRRLSNDPPEVFSDEPVFMRDGQRLLHSSNRGGATNLWILPLDGRTPERLTTGPGPDTSPTLAVNGDVSFVNSRWRAGLLVHDLGKADTRTLLTHPVTLWSPAFSPDGHELAFSRREVDGSWHLWSITVDGSSPRQLTSGELGEINPRYTNDGSSIIYHTWGAPRRIWRIPREGGRGVALTPAGVDASFADMSPDGGWLAYVSTEKTLERVYVMPLAGGPPRPLSNEPASLPRWSPDGSWISFARNRGYESGIFIAHPDGTGERRLSATGGWPVWWPDGRRIAYLTITPDGRQQIESVALDGTETPPAVKIRFEGTNNPIAFSSDGRTLATSDQVHVSDEIWLLRSR